MVTRDAVVAEARSWLNVPWLHQGRTRHGIDCIGLVVVVRAALDIGYDDIAGYAREPDGSIMTRFLGAGGVRVGILQAQPGDLILFRDARAPCHVGMITQREGEVMYMLHAHALRRKVIEEPVLHEWQQKWVAAFQMPGVD